MFFKTHLIVTVLWIFSCSTLYAQTYSEDTDGLRGRNAVTVALGSSVINGDFESPLFEIYTHIGYKRFIGKYVNIGVSYHKFNLAYKNVFNEGFMSFDVDLEGYLLPNKDLTPFLAVGAGWWAANYFESDDYKLQAGGGLEYLVADSVGVKLFAQYNYLFTDELDGRIAGNADDAYWHLALGLNIYFGKRNAKPKIKKGEPTLINSYPIIHHKTE